MPVALVIWTACLVAVPAVVLAHQAATDSGTTVSPAAESRDDTPAADPADPAATAPGQSTVGDASPDAPVDAPAAAPAGATTQVLPAGDTADPVLPPAQDAATARSSDPTAIVSVSVPPSSAPRTTAAASSPAATSSPTSPAATSAESSAAELSAEPCADCPPA